MLQQFILKRKIEQKLLSYNCRSAGWFAKYIMTEDSMLLIIASVIYSEQVYILTTWELIWELIALTTGVMLVLFFSFLTIV